MMRQILLAAATLVIGYVVGTISGYRAAVADYVENDAQTIEKVASSMYEQEEQEQVPETVSDSAEEVESAEASSGTGSRGFQ